MDRLRMLRERREHNTDLDVTPFMNLMIVLVPVLLLSMVFTHTAVIDLDFPAGGADPNKVLDPDKLQLEVRVYDNQLVVADARGGVIRRLKKKGGVHDFEGLSNVMQEIKRRHTGQSLEANAKSIGLHWLFEPSVNFYRVRYDLPYLQRAHRGGPFDRFDYYYLFDRDDPDLRDRRIRMRLTEELRNGLETIKSYDVSNTVLAVPRD